MTHRNLETRYTLQDILAHPSMERCELAKSTHLCALKRNLMRISTIHAPQPESLANTPKALWSRQSEEETFFSRQPNVFYSQQESAEMIDTSSRHSSQSERIVGDNAGESEHELRFAEVRERRGRLLSGSPEAVRVQIREGSSGDYEERFFLNIKSK